MNLRVYTIILYLLSPFIWGYFLVRAIKAPEYREGFWQRLGLRLNSNNKQLTNQQRIVVHCASVGEVIAARPLIEKLLDTYTDDSHIVVTTSSPTGKQTVKKLFADRVMHAYLPIDWPGSCRRFIQTIKPKLLILMETELWPNILHCCQQKQIPVLLANARLSDKSLSKYQQYPRLTRDIFSNITRIAAQYDSDRINFLKLGISSDKLKMVGSIKFDINLTEQIIADQKSFRDDWVGNRPTWVAASIHPDEFEWILKAHRRLLKQFPDLLLIAVARHPEQFETLKQDCQLHQLKFVSRSLNIPPTENEQVVVADTMGEMLLYCGAANLAYVGGSLIPRGGHNPIEPVSCGTPVIMGPSVYNFSEVCQILANQGVLITLDSEENLADSIAGWLGDREKLNQLSAKTAQIMRQNRGSVERLLNEVRALI